MNFTTNNTTTTLVSALVSARTRCEQAIKKINQKIWETGSLPNKLTMLALNSTAAYAVGVDPTYLAVLVLCTIFICLNTIPRWLLEVCVIANLLLVSTATLPESSVTTFEYLVLVKFMFEFYCSLFDKFVQAYAKWAADQKHSYYFFGIVAMSILLSTAQSCPYVQGFIKGLLQGFAGN